MEQSRFGGNVTVGKRAPLERVPMGPIKKAPVVARTGGMQPKGALLKPAALVGVRIGKRARNHDPEAARQRRLGGAIAGTGIGGVGLVASGGRNIVQDTGRIRDIAHGYTVGAEPRQPPRSRREAGRFSRIPDEEYSELLAAHDRKHGAWRRKVKTAEGLDFVARDRPALVTARAAGKIGAGLGLLGVGGHLARRSHTRRWT